MNTKQLMEKAVEFHGHACPGVAIGVMAAKYVLDHGADFSIDEELVAIVENDNCSVDGIQALLGTTFGKGNLIFKDFGKNSYTFFNRKTNKAVRLSLRENLFSNKDKSRDERIEELLNARPEDIFDIKEADMKVPEYAQRRDSIICYNCGEPTMDTKAREHNGVMLCIPCYEEEVRKSKP